MPKWYMGANHGWKTGKPTSNKEAMTGGRIQEVEEFAELLGAMARRGLSHNLTAEPE